MANSITAHCILGSDDHIVPVKHTKKDREPEGLHIIRERGIRNNMDKSKSKLNIQKTAKSQKKKIKDLTSVILLPSRVVKKFRFHTLPKCLALFTTSDVKFSSSTSKINPLSCSILSMKTNLESAELAGSTG